MRIVIILPTYNERSNLARLLPALRVQLASLPHDWHILVVDDNSPDGTAAVARAAQKEYDNIDLITGEKQGLGAAYIRGMQHACAALRAEVVMQMDADFSHKPQDVPRLIAAIDDGADFVIGSRYVKGGTIPQQWGFFRRANSYFGNLVARYVAGLSPVRDCTAGFRAIRTSILIRTSFEDLRVKGYAFQVALLHEAKTAGARIEEVPVDFIERSEGKSKLGLSDILEFIVNAWWIRFRSSRTFIKFALVGISGVVVNLGVFTALLAAGVNKFAASPIAIEVSIITNFLLNNFWTFRWRKTTAKVRVKGIKFNIVSILALAFSFGTFVALSLLFPTIDPRIHQIIGIIPATFVNYFLNSYWTFRNDRDA